MHQRTALRAGEKRAVDILRVFFAAQNHSAARAAQSFVRGGGNEIGVRHRARMDARGDQSRDVRHVHEEHRAHRLRDFRHAREINDARIGARAHDHHFRLVLLREAVEIVVVDGFGFLRDAVGHEFVRLAPKNSADGRASGGRRARGSCRAPCRRASAWPGRRPYSPARRSAAARSRARRRKAAFARSIASCSALFTNSQPP